MEQWIRGTKVQQLLEKLSSCNVKAIGVDRYQYDPQNRLIAATLTASGNQSQAMTYDRHGNVTQIVRNGVATSVPVQAASNHLSAPAVYDASGNLTYRLAAGPAQQLSYDSQNRVQTLQGPDVAKGFVYTADGERLLEIDFGDPWTETWSIRDLGGNVLRQWQHVPSGNGGFGRWTWTMSLWSIPACAGEPEFHAGFLPDDWVNPRVCGGTVKSRTMSVTS